MQVVGELATTVQSLSIRQIKLNQRNSRTHSAKQIRQIANSIMAFGFTNPLLITEDGTLIAGEGRYKAAQLLGLVKVPLIVLTRLSPARLRALAIADNKIGNNAGWDRERLAIEIPELAGLLETEGLDVTDLWGRTLRRRSQKDRMTWARMTQWVDPGFQNRSSYILGRVIALPSHTQGGSRCGKAARTVLCGRRAISDLVQHVGDGKARMAQRLTRAGPGPQWRLSGTDAQGGATSDWPSLYHPMEVGGYKSRCKQVRSRRGSLSGTGSKVHGLPWHHKRKRSSMITKFSVAVVFAVLFGSLSFAQDAGSQKFLKEAIEGNLAEVEMGKLSQKQGASEGVRAFGQMLEKDHSDANQKATAVANSVSITAPTAPNKKQKADYDKISKLSGAKFDKEFAAHMVADHKKDIKEYEKAAKKQDAVGNYAKETLPTLRKHLETAQSLMALPPLQTRPQKRRPWLRSQHPRQAFPHPHLRLRGAKRCVSRPGIRPVGGLTGW